MYSPLRYIGHIFWKRRPIQLTFFITRRCNAHCPFCFYLKEEREAGGTELTLEEIGAVSTSMGRLLWLAFSGGEVYLRQDLADISRIFYKNNKPTIMLFSTNGLLPGLIKEKTEEILESCPQSVVVVKLSLDGLGGAHDALRGVSGSFDKLIKTYELLSPLLRKYPNFELGINTVFCAQNQDNIEGIFQFVQGMRHVRTHTLSLIRGQLKEESLRDVDLHKYHRLTQWLEQNLKQKKAHYRFPGARVKSAQDILQRRLIYRTAVKQKRLLPCYAGRLNLVLTESGKVYPCELSNQELGNVKEYDFDVGKVLESERANRLIRAIDKQRCYCTHECYMMTNILFNPRMYPALLKEYLKLRYPYVRRGRLIF